jgi:hypothetical protein
MEIRTTTDKQTIQYALEIIEDDHPDLILHDWAMDIPDWQTHADFYLCFDGDGDECDEYIGYFCFTYFDGDKLGIHFGMRKTLQAMRCFNEGMERVYQLTKNYYQKDKLYVWVTGDMRRFVSKYGFKFVSGDEYVKSL